MVQRLGADQYNGYYSAKVGSKTAIGKYLYTIGKPLGKNQTSSYTVPQYAALAGEYTREQYDYYMDGATRVYTNPREGEERLNDGKAGECVLMVVSTNEGEGITIKPAGAKAFSLISGTNSFSLERQVDAVLKSGILQENDIVFFVASEGKSGKTGKCEIYPSDIGQVHVGSVATTLTYSAANSYAFRESILSATKKYVGMDFVILNSDEQPIDEMRRIYGGE